jgi:uncharacterized protein (TIGR02452 family)
MASNYSFEPWRCSQCTYVNPPDFTKCEMCENPRPTHSSNQYESIIASQNQHETLTTPSELSSASSSPYSSAHRFSSVPDSPKYFSSSCKIDPIAEQSLHQQDTFSSKWECEACTFENKSNMGHCSICGEGLRPYVMTQVMSNNPFQQPLRSHSLQPELNLYPILFREKSATKEIDTIVTPTAYRVSASSIIPSSSEQKIFVFIPDLPFNKSNTNLEQMIRLRLSNDYRVHITNVICHSNISIGIIHVASEEDKNYLVKNIQSTILDPQTNTIIKFVEELQLISYLVFDQTMKTIVTSNDIIYRWQQICKSSQLSTCEVVAAQFPNIFKIVSRSLDELLAIENVNLFTIKDQSARIYLNADCSFFEDLPPNITTSQVTVAINAQIGDQFDQSSLYVQYNKATASAIVLAINAARSRTNINCIIVNRQCCMKKKRLAFRLVLHCVPREIPINTVIQHKQLQNAVTNSIRIGDKLIIEVKDKSVYDACVSAAVIHLNDHFVPIGPFIAINNDPENMEINAETWYETQMLDYQPDLKYFMDNPQHPIFKYKWNVRSWLEQFQRYRGIHNDEYDKQRRLLRVTVMLNTIGVLLKNGYTIEINYNKKEIRLNLQRMKNIIYNHRSKLGNRKEITTSITTPFSSTMVKVVNEDCLVVYQRLASEHNRPALLNLANAQTPGGGYRKGAGAQEENLFRRSNYYLSLDMEFDYNKQADRFWCTANCEQKPVDIHQNIYPIEEYGAIYTSGITVFRHSEDKGYAYLEQPVYGVCAIASAAYARPELKRNDNNFLVEKYAVDTRKKIENIFAIAYHHGHDCLVLSAFGCGAFKNPPNHIAMIFKSVIEQYAGYFKIIYFSIIDDHNTGYQLNLDGNYRPFKNILDDKNFQPSKGEIDVNMISGPYRVISKNQGKITIDHVKIFDLPPCEYGSLCQDLNNTQHSRSYSHPPICPRYNSCNQSENDDVHLSSFIHRTKCAQGGICKLIKDQNHLRLYDHPEFCTDRSCKIMDKSHLMKFRHVDLCQNGLKCPLYLEKNPDHCHSRRHCQLDCQFSGYCVNFHDQEHINDRSHPFRKPCSFTPYACKYHMEYLQTKKDPSSKIRREVEQHCYNYSHICPFGRQCQNKSDLHIETSIHIARNLCPDGNHCSKLTNEEHLNSFTHPNIHDIRFECRYSCSQCRERRNRDHIIYYRHTGNYNHIGIARYSGLNKNTNFVRNHHQLIKAVHTYTESQRWKPVKDTVEEITEWIRSLQPIHRCNRDIFESIAIHGHVMSRQYMDNLRNGQFVANAIEQHQNIRRIFNQYNNPVLQGYGRDFIRAVVAIEFDKAARPRALPNGLAGAAFRPAHVPSGQFHNVQLSESLMKRHLKQDEINFIRDLAIEIAKASLRLHANPTGIGYKPDESFGTNNHVFSILGPNLGHYYGDIFIVFTHELMFHPDSNFSIQAATTFGQSGNAYRHRPWLRDPGTIKDRIQHYHWTKLHCSIPGYEYAAGMELMALREHVKMYSARTAAIPSFLYSAVPLFRYSVIPRLFLYSAIPLFRHSPTIPLFRYSPIPLFRYSSIPLFPHSHIINRSL